MMIGKRFFDLLLATTGLIVLAPFILLIACWIKADSPGSVFFRQKRIGLGGKPFHILKFRTMVQNAEGMGAKVTVGRDPRITRSGHFLRRCKLDEIPQLINILKGEMSLVGPRPEVPEYVAHWPADIRELVLSVPPGITDFAAIHFRNESEILQRSADPARMYVEEIIPIKLAYYVRYVRERSLWLDFKLIFKTLATVVKTGPQ